MKTIKELKVKLEKATHYCDTNSEADVIEAQLQTLKDIKKLIDEIDIELFLTDIKDKQGNKIEISDEIMEIIRIWWEQKSEEIKQRIEGGK